MGLDEFRIFLVGWRRDLRTVLREDPENHIGRRNPASAENITDMFPDPGVVQSYIMPVTSISHAQQLPSINDKQLPDVARIGELCERYFEWATPSGILPKFLKHIWPGVVLRMVRDDILNANNMQELGGHSPEVRDMSNTSPLSCSPVNIVACYHCT
jgi:holliday junction resolvase YEN1